jgi:hypothetical protein
MDSVEITSGNAVTSATAIRYRKAKRRIFETPMLILPRQVGTLFDARAQ